MKHIGFKTMLLAVLLAFVLVACEETTTPTNNELKPPSGLTATTVSSTSVKLEWIASPSSSNANFEGYVLNISPGNFQPMDIPKSQTNYTVSGLPGGTTYTFTLNAKMDGDNSTAISVNWIFTPEPPKNLRATSISSTSIKIKWDLSVSESEIGFQGYTIEISPGTFVPINTPKGQDTYTIEGLTEGNIYTINLFSKFGEVESKTSATVLWSPATRFIVTGNDAPIRLYETDSDFGSGLDLYESVSMAPKILKVASGIDWNMALDTRTSGQVIVASPTMVDYNYGSTPGVTQISDNYFEANSLDDVFDSQALNTGTFAERSIDLESLNTTTGVVLVLRTKEGANTEFTYAKVLIKKTGGNWLQGETGNRYIECVVSYQMTAGVPYAF